MALRPRYRCLRYVTFITEFFYKLSCSIIEFHSTKRIDSVTTVTDPAIKDNEICMVIQPEIPGWFRMRK